MANSLKYISKFNIHKFRFTVNKTTESFKEKFNNCGNLILPFSLFSRDVTSVADLSGISDETISTFSTNSHKEIPFKLYTRDDNYPSPSKCGY